MQQTGRTFRIFISSTFTDMEAERNALQEKVFPRLRELCEDNGCRFQAVDLRWGVREEAALDQRTMEICLEELSRCQKVTPRPNFLVLLGDRDGWMPLPYRIGAGEFEQMRGKIENEEKRELLSVWYERDDNSVPPAYYLRPRTGGHEEQEAWEEVEASLRSAILGAAGKVDIPPEERSKYMASATEQEISSGALSIPDAPEHVFAFFRAIEGDPPGREVASGYLDLDSGGEPLEDSRIKVEGLKGRLREKLGDNVHEYEAGWDTEGITTDHIDALCEDVYAELSRVISAQIQSLEERDELEREVEEHRLFASERSEFFTGREEMLERIAGYVEGDDPHPLAVYGEGGSGKSALAACAIKKAQEDHPGAEVIYRFIGATPSSSDVRELLESLCAELSRAYGKKESSIPTEYEELVTEFRSRLSMATEDKLLILFIDSLDQLSEAHDAASLNWLPDRLPANVRMVVTARSGRALAALRSKLPEENVEKLGPMPEEEGSQLLDIWLEDAGRTLTTPQRQEVLSEFGEAGGNPLYLRLAFEEARRWGSVAGEVDLSSDVNGIIRDLYARLSLEANHGPLLVSRSLGYLAASREGLSEDELLDILSLDSEVFKDFTERSRHEPPERKLPVVIWSRLYYDLESYLTERTSNGASLLTFYHRELGEVARAKYLKGDEAKKRHRVLADYFALQDIGPRKIKELPWQLSRVEDWEMLFRLLSMPSFFSAAWKANPLEVKDYWVQVEDNSELRMVNAYRPILDNPDSYQEHIWNLSALLNDTGHLQEALSLRGYIVEHYRKSEDRGNLANALNNMARILFAQGDLEGAIQLYKEGERICRDLGNKDGLARNLGNQANIHYAQGDFGYAMRLFREIEQMFQELGDMTGLARTLGNQAGVLYAQGDLEGAMHLYQEQARICRELIDRDGLAVSLGGQANILRARGDLDKALLLLKDEEQICRDIGDNEGLASSLINQAGILIKMEKPSGALDHAKEAYQLASDSGYAALIQIIKPILEYLS